MRFINNYRDFENLKNIFDFLHKSKDEGGMEMSVRQISEVLNKDRRTASTWFRKAGLKIRTGTPIEMGLLVDEPSSSFTENINGIKIKKIPFVSNKNLLWLLGFSLGEGSFSSGTLEIGNKNFSLLPILKKLLSKYGSISIHYDNVLSGIIDGSPYELNTTYVKDVPRENANYFRIKLYNSAFARMIKNEFSSINKDIIKFVVSNKKLMKPFLAGFWDADGFISSSFYLKRKRKEFNIRIGIVQKDSVETRRFIDAIKYKLEFLFDIKSRIINKKCKRIFFNNNKKYVYEKSRIDLVISRHKDAVKWLTEFKDFLRNSEKIKNSYKILSLVKQ